MSKRTPILATLPLWLATFAVAQETPRRELPRPMEFVAGQDDNLFSLLRSQDNIHEWELALQEIEAGDHAEAAERLHRLLQNEYGGVAPIGPRRYFGQRLAVIQTLANMSPAAIEAYETLVQREAGYLVERPAHSLLPEQLELLAQRYPTSRAGQQARLRLGDLALEQGLGHTAIGHFRRALDASAIGSRLERTVVARMQAARTLLEPGRARAEATEQRLSAAAAEVLEVLPPATDSTGWTSVGGGGDGGTPMTRPAGQPTANRIEAVRAPGFEQHSSGRFAMMPTGDLDGIYVNNGRKLYAFDPLRDGIAWETIAPLGGGQRDFGGRDREQGQVNHDMVLAAAYGGDVVVAPLQVPDRSVTVEFRRGLRIMSKIPQRRLFAYSRSTGKLVWSHFDHLDGRRATQFRGHDVCGPPLAAGDTLFVPVHDRSGAIAFSVAAYDLHSGEPKWRRLVCSSQQEVNMFGNARMEYASSPLCLSDGVLYGTSNLGVAFAVDAQTGETRWVTAYDVVQMPTTRFRQQESRPVYFMNNAPIAADGVVCLTPLDSPYALGIDAETGRMLWRIPAEAPVAGIDHDVRWLCGVLDGEFVLTGRGAIAVKPRSGRSLLSDQADLRQLVAPQVWMQGARSSLTGRPAVTAEHLWVARRGSITAFDKHGDPIAAARQIHAPSFDGGNLLLVDGIIASLRLGTFEAFLDQRAILANVEERHRRTPDDPAAILRLASLRSALLPPAASQSERAAVTTLYRRGLEAAKKNLMPPTHPVRSALQRELHAQAKQAANAAIRSGDPDVHALLATARDTAPDAPSWLAVQQLVLEQCAGDAERMAAELDRLEQEAAGATLLLRSGPQPVRAYVLYRRVELPATPAAKVGIWQELLEQYPTAEFDGEAMAETARVAIAALIARHGDGCYAAVAARAEQTLQAAGDDPDALREIGMRFPNSAAAERARTRVLDGAVQRGELALACEVLAQELAKPTADPRILRRVLVAAQKRGNLGLCRALATRLLAYGNASSDWPADGGRSFADVAGALLAALQPTPPINRLGLPTHELARINPRTPRESFRLVQLHAADGFTAPPDTPLFVLANSDLLAIDVHQDQPPILFSTRVSYLDHVVLCGTTLVVPDLERVFAVDYRTGKLLWDLPEMPGFMLDGLGVRSGVFHLGAQPSDSEGDALLIAIEPLTGAILFERSLPGGRMRPIPKPIASGQLLAMHADEQGRTTLRRLDPLTGTSERTIELKELAPRTAGITTRVYPQGLCGNAELVYLPIDSTFAGDSPRLLAVRDDGEVAWRWQGLRDSHLPMAALRGDRLIIVERNARQPGRVTILRASDGHELQTVPLGHDIDLLNWQPSYQPTPAPAALLLSDLATPDGRERRFYCIGIDPGQPSFIEPLNRQLGEIERRPQFGADFLTFGVRPARQGPFRVYALNLGDREGAFADGQKYVSHRVGPTYALTAVGPYTVLCCADCLVVLGAEERNR